MSATEIKPRLCHVVRGSGGYGFHLHGEKNKPGQFVRKVEADSPAEEACLLVGDKIIQVNGRNVEDEDHHEVVARIKEKSGETTLLVVDSVSDQYYKERNIRITEELLISSEDTVSPAPTDEVQKELRPRLCHLVRGAAGFGFNLHSEKGKQGSFIKSVEADGPSETAGLKGGDRIIEINGTNFEYEKHNALVAAIKDSGSEVDMLVVDEETDKFFKDLNVTATKQHLTGPLPTRQSKADVSDKSKASVDEPAAAPVASTTASTPASNGVDLPNMDLATLKEKSRSSRKKNVPQSNWNNRQAIFNNL